MFVKKVKTNLKYDREVDLGPLQIVSGANATGKTGLLESISLVLTGDSARFGKDGKRALAATVGDGEVKTAVIEAGLSNGGQARWTCEGSMEKSSRPKHTAEIKASIVRGNGLEAIRDGGAKLTNWLIKIAGDDKAQAKKHKDVLVGLAEVDFPYWYSITKTKENDRFDPTKLEVWRKEADKAKRTVSAELKEIASAREAGLTPLSPGEALELQGLETKLEQSTSAPRTQPGVDPTQAILERLEAPEVAPIRLVTNLQSLLGEVTTYMTVGKKSEINCPCCQSTKVTHTQLRERMEKIGETLRKFEPTYEEVVKLQRQLVQVRNKGNDQAQAAEMTKADYSRLNELKGQQSAYDLLSSRIANEGKLKHQLVSLKGIVEFIDTLRRIYAKSGAELLEKLSSRVLPKGVVIECKLNKGNYILGMERRGFWTPLNALSGAESAMALAAVEASVCADKDTDIRMLVIDDVWFDRTNLVALLKALTPHVGEDKALTQVIVNCVEWRGKPPKGWERLDLDKMCKGEEAKEDAAVAEEIGEPDIDEQAKDVVPNAALLGGNGKDTSGTFDDLGL